MTMKNGAELISVVYPASEKIDWSSGMHIVIPYVFGQTVLNNAVGVNAAGIIHAEGTVFRKFSVVARSATLFRKFSNPPDLRRISLKGDIS